MPPNVQAHKCLLFLGLSFFENLTLGLFVIFLCKIIEYLIISYLVARISEKRRMGNGFEMGSFFFGLPGASLCKGLLLIGLCSFLCFLKWVRLSYFMFFCSNIWVIW